MGTNGEEWMSEFDTIKNWPEDGLEWLGHCPVCGASERSVLHEGLRDHVFYCAPGEWTLFRCQACGSGYLDPRPTCESIGLAYRRYYTHSTRPLRPTNELGWWDRIRRTLANGYRNYRFGTQLRPASLLGVLAVMLFPSQRSLIDAEGRHLPRPMEGARLLDVGCGNGDFLGVAQRAGWKGVGVELDAKAAATARERGFDVRLGGIEVLDPENERFDGVTLSHVIEHVHNPLEVLRACRRLLKRGGWIWLETPNIEAAGHMRYGACWRGLEPPRHLILFSHASLTHTLEKAGFRGIQVQAYRPQCEHMWGASEAIRQGLDPYTYLESREESLRTAQRADDVAQRTPSVREFITVKAWKAH